MNLKSVIVGAVGALVVTSASLVATPGVADAATRPSAPKAYVTVKNRCSVVANAYWTAYYTGTRSVTSINPGATMSNRLVPLGSIVTVSSGGRSIGYKITATYVSLRAC